MKRPAAGKKAFEARGRSAQALGLPLTMQGKGSWPDWARTAYARGHVYNPPLKTKK